MIQFKDGFGNVNMRQGNQFNGKILDTIRALGLILGVRTDQIEALAKVSGSYSPFQLDKSGHIKTILNDITWITSNGTTITTATTTTILAELQNNFYYRLYYLQACNLNAISEIIRWNFKGGMDSAASNKTSRGLGLNQEQVIDMKPGYTDLSPGTGLSLVTVNGGAAIEWTVGYSIMLVG